MEIRHRKQFLTGKMVAQVRFGDGDRLDADDDDIRFVRNLEAMDASSKLKWAEMENEFLKSQLSDLQRKIKKMRKERKSALNCARANMRSCADYANKNEQLISQLSEALGKIREYREAEERKIPQIMSVHVDNSKGFYALKIVDLATGKDVHWSNSVDEDTMYRNIPTVIRRILAKNGQIPAKYDNDTPSVSDELGTNAYPIPHHGPGLVAAEDAMREDGEPAQDDINHPSHYQGDNGIECIDAIHSALTPEEFRGYCKGNIMKYVWRERTKQGDDSVRKARWYLNRMLGDA